MFELNGRLARLEVDGDSRALFGALAVNPEAASRFLGTIAGTVPVEDFWHDRNLRRVVLGGVARRAGRRLRSSAGRLVPGTGG